MADNLITFRVFRGDAKAGEVREYKVPLVPGMVVLDAMHYIQAHYDGDLAIRWNCKAARCGSCSAEVNGRPRLMCKTRVEEFVGQDIYVYPMKSFRVIKDLVTDVNRNYEHAKKIPAFTPRQDDPSPWIIYQEDMDRVQEFRKCIECFLCQNVCHVLRDHDAPFFGPRHMVKIAALEMHPKDTLRRTAFLKDEAKIGYCNITKCCTEVCPEHITITDNAIIPLKERVADDHFDPIAALVRKLKGEQ